MLTMEPDPICSDWPTVGDNRGAAATAADVSARLARLDVTDIEREWLPLLAASAAELAAVAEITWGFGTDDPAVALLRLIAKATLKCPEASGPHTERLMTQLR